MAGASPVCDNGGQLMSQSPFEPYPAQVEIVRTPDYREGYANSIQVRVNLWDFLLVFGRLNQNPAGHVSIEVFQGIYLSPQQAKALANVLNQNLAQYEATFGAIRLEPLAPEGAIH